MEYLEIWAADLTDSGHGHVQKGMRPVVIVSNNKANHFAPTVSVVPLTSKQKKTTLPTHVSICGYGLQHPSQILCEAIITLDKSKMRRKIGTITEQSDQSAIQHALAAQLNLRIVSYSTP